jgi:hypothetical protein
MSSQVAPMEPPGTTGPEKQINIPDRYTGLDVIFLVSMETMSINGYSGVTSTLKSQK